MDDLRIALGVLRARVLSECTPDSCVITCKAAQQLLRTYGLETRPLTVQVVVANRAYREATDPRSDPEAYSIGLGWGGDSTKVKHLVLLTDDRLIDPSLDQASRPAKNMPIEPSILALRPGDREKLLAGEPVSWINDRTGVSLTYYGLPDDLSYTTSPNWGNRDRSIVDRMVGDTIRTLRRVGAAAQIADFPVIA